jgi:hypothetical protein
MPATYASWRRRATPRSVAAAQSRPRPGRAPDRRLSIDFGVGNPSLFRLLSDPDRVRQSPAARTGREVLEARIHRVAATGRLRVSEQRATSLLQAAAIGAIQTLLATPPEDPDPGLAESMCDAVLGQIITDPPAPAPADGDTIATAVALRAMAPRLDALTRAERQMLASGSTA